MSPPLWLEKDQRSHLGFSLGWMPKSFRWITLYKIIFHLASLHFAFMFVEWKSGLVLPPVITILFPEWCILLTCRVFLLWWVSTSVWYLMLLICAAVTWCNCSFWLSAEAYNGLCGCLLWAVAVHLADVLWHLLGTFSTSLWCLKCPVLLFLPQEKKATLNDCGFGQEQVT